MITWGSSALGVNLYYIVQEFSQYCFTLLCALLPKFVGRDLGCHVRSEILSRAVVATATVTAGSHDLPMQCDCRRGNSRRKSRHVYVKCDETGSSAYDYCIIISASS